ncbi:hypothetical protein M9Y10_032201 [Tritrichomonas musculus]|uniref:RBR-type E3 ubiquitin transferase n=1 Tax=Tritrichomonas musculus TaxID=1915356 RepID=A0ABR2GZA7_9EUKA
MADFDEILDIGAKVREKYNQDPSQDDWFNGIIEFYNQNSEFPEEAGKEVLQYLKSIGDSESIDLSNDVARIMDLEDTADNILSAIFFGEDENPVDYIQEEEGFIVEEEQVEEDEKDGPQQFFDDQINKLSDTLTISYDLSYLLLKNNGWSSNVTLNAWIKNQKEMLSSFHIKLGSPNFPKANSPITAQPCGEGSCPQCFEDKELLQLYCGHKICQDCLASEITTLVNNNKLPICREMDEKSSKQCCSEVIPSDIYNCITDHKILERYYQIRLKSECENSPEAKICSVCKSLITKIDDVGCHTGICPNCHFAKCLKCQFEGSHAPLVNCKHVSEFTVDIKNKMKLLEQAQTLWYMREERLRFHRRKHQNEFLPYFDNIISNYRKIMSKCDKEELERISKLEAELKASENKLSRAIGHAKNEEVEKIEKEVESNRKSLQRSKSDHKIEGQDRQKYLTRLNKWKQYYIWSITEERHPFQNGILKFKKKLNRLVNQSTVSSIDEDKNTAQLTKKCPKCGYPIYKQGGCHYVQCGNCHYEFCWICEQKWEPPHGDHHVCPVYSLSAGQITNRVINGINYDDPKDTKFYPLPLDLEKSAEFSKWNNLYMEYNKNSKKYDELVDLFAENNNKNSVRNMLIQSLMTENSESTSIEMATKILNDILFAQSVMVWGYPQMFYMLSKPVSYKFVEYSLSELEVLVKDALEVVKSSSIPNPTEYFENSLDIIRKKIQSITNTCENF